MYEELKKLAKACRQDQWLSKTSSEDPDDGAIVYIEIPNASPNAISVLFDADWATDAETDFVAAANPSAVLALIKDLESHKRMLLAAACDIGAIGKALKADMNADGDELLGMVINLKAQNTRMLEWLKDISRTSGDKGAVMGTRQLLKEFGQ